MPKVIIACKLCQADFMAYACMKRQYCSPKCANIVIAGHRTHGHAGVAKRSREYRAWSDMRTRCSNPRFVYFDQYGGRGIKVCERWNKFENFLEDMGPQPSDGKRYSLDREKVNGDYEPGNCRWASYAQQARNRQGNVWHSAFGISMIASDWAKTLGISSGTISTWPKLYPDLNFEEMIARCKKR